MILTNVYLSYGYTAKISGLRSFNIIKPLQPHLSGVKLYCKTTRIPQGFRAATLMDNSRETHNDGCLNSRGTKKVSTCKVRNIMGDLKKSLCTGSPSMDNTLWDTLPIKIGEFLNQMIVLKENWT